MPTVIITNQPASVTVVPGQNTTFSVNASADFSPATYAYQWKRGGVNIPAATTSKYFIEPVIGDNQSSFTVSVSALSGTPLQSVATVNSTTATLSVVADTDIFGKFAIYPESGKERFTRLRHLGYV